MIAIAGGILVAFVILANLDLFIRLLWFGILFCLIAIVTFIALSLFA